MAQQMNDEQAVAAFHAMWDEFPGLARLIDSHHRVMAANAIAEGKGFVSGAVCARVGDPAIHRECKLAAMFSTGEAQTDDVLGDRIRGWRPVKGRDDLCVHFALML